jgi:hypothetical protein
MKNENQKRYDEAGIHGFPEVISDAVCCFCKAQKANGAKIRYLRGIDEFACDKCYKEKTL